MSSTTLSELTKLVIKKMAANGEMITPKAYAITFCQEAKAHGVIVPECTELATLIEKLDPATKELLKRYTVRSVDDLLLFLIYRIKSLHEGDKNSTSKKILEDLAIEQLADFIASLLLASISHEIDEEILAMKGKLHQHPSLITIESFQKDVKSLVSKRVVYDRKAVKEEITSINRMVDALSKKTIGSVIASQSAQKRIDLVQQEVSGVKCETVAEQNFFEPLHKKLVILLDLLEKESRSLTQALEESQAEVEELHRRVGYLEKSVHSETKNSTCDVLTNLYNDQGWHIQLATFEQRFRESSENYGIAFFEIDFLEDIQRRYGAEAADTVTRTFGQILAKKVRLDDVVARIKSDRFAITLANISPQASTAAVTKIHEVIGKTKFLYKEEIITVTASVGLTWRLKYQDLEAMLLDVDLILHKAIKAGRNHVAV